MSDQTKFALQNPDMFLRGEMLDEYRAFVDSKMKKGEDTLAQMTPLKAELVHAAMGLTTEAGEFADAVKKHVFYNKPLDVENLIEEAGDLLFYLFDALTKIGVPVEIAIDRNVSKLNKRYKASFSDAEAAARADKEEGQ